jgi:dTDP-glucose 4,6-dehydratase
VITELGLDPAEWIEHIPDRPNHDRRYLIDPRKIETVLGWKPERHFDTSLGEVVAWYRDNQPWWEAILSEKGELGFDWANPAQR